MSTLPAGAVSMPAAASPSPQDIAAAQRAAGHSDEQAALACEAGHRNTWYKWRTGERSMPAAAWTLYLLATDQHPTFRLVQK